MKDNFTQKSVKDFWNSVAYKYEETNATVKQIHYQRFEQAMTYNLSYEPKKILNVWSRTGEAIPYIKKKYPNAEIYNLEISDKMVEIFRKKYPKENIGMLNFSNFNFPDNYFDLVISLETIEHSPNPVIFLEEIYRVLKANKNLILSCPSAFSEIILFVYELFFDNHGEGPHKFLSSNDMKKKFFFTNFTLIEHRGFIFFPIIGKLTKIINNMLEYVLNKINLSDIGIRQFYFLKKNEIYKNR